MSVGKRWLLTRNALVSDKDATDINLRHPDVMTKLDRLERELGLKIAPVAEAWREDRDRVRRWLRLGR